MKKVLYIVLLLCLFPMAVFASDVKITNVEVLEKTAGVEVESNKFEGLLTNLNFKLTEYADSIKYKITIKNDSSEVFNIDLKSNAETSKYLDYTYTGDKAIEPGQTGSITVQVDYVKHLEKDDLKTEQYVDNVKLALTSNEVKDTPKTEDPKEDKKEDKKEEKENPATGVGLRAIIIISIDLIIVGVIVYSRIKGKSKIISYMLLPLLVLPIIYSVKAEERLVININSTIVNKPFILRYVPYQDNIYPHGAEIRYVDIDEKDIIKYEIPQTCNSDYGTLFGNFKGYTVDEIKAMIREMGYPLFDISDTKGIENLKKELTEETTYVILQETSRTITGYMHLYMPSTKYDIVMDTIEYDKETQLAISINTVMLDASDVFGCILTSNPTVTHFTRSNNADEYTINGGNIIERDNFITALRAHAKLLNQKYLIMIDEDRPQVFEIFSKEGLNIIEEDYDMCELGRYYNEEGRAPHFRTTMDMAYNIGGNKYIANAMDEPTFFYDNESAVYHTIVYR